ncbi:MAG: hypothetical protein AAGI34_07410 [Pseudomonadota bacterium]
MSKTPPEETLRDGNLKASIWRNESEKGPYWSVTFAKTFRDHEGNYKDAQSFTGTDMLRLAELARDSYARTNELRRDYLRGRDPDHRPSTEFEREATRERARNRPRPR